MGFKNLMLIRRVSSASTCSRIDKLRNHNLAARAAEQNLVNGKRCFPVDCTSTEAIDNINPATGKAIGQFYISGSLEVDRAIQNSKDAFESWSQTTASERSSLIRRVGRHLRRHIHEIAKLETIDTGKSITESTFDVEAAIEACSYFSSVCYSLEGQHIPIHKDAFAYTIREPLGVCAGIGAWNFPINNLAWKALPALACGNTMVYKPSPLTPLSSAIFAELMIEVGLPPGCLNIVQGEGLVGQTFCSHPDVAKVSFTGSAETGAKVMAACAEHIKPVTLELGGKSPLIIFEDADINNAVQGALMANFLTQGEVCSNAARVYVHESIYEEFLSKVVNACQKMIIGDTMSARVKIGALISKEHLEKVQGFIDRAVGEGANILCGGVQPKLPGANADGYYLTPCVMDNCHDQMEIIQEEHFGPIMCIMKFSAEDEVVARSNNTPYGLSGGVFTRDLSRAHRIASKLNVGTFTINTYNMYPVTIPFGGVKKSGIGRENGTAVLNHYTQLKTVYVELGDVETAF